MYCNQCGNILTEQGAFCSFCGAKNEENIVQPNPTAEASQPMPAFGEHLISTNENATAAPTPETQPAPVLSSPITPTGYTSIPQTPPPVSQSVKEERYYTFNHILLCLGAAAIMAITAGVFAGLYFSTF